MNEQERAAMEHALEALEYENSWHEIFKIRPYASTVDAITALRAALAQQAESVQEPVGEILPNWSTEKECIDGTWAYLNDLGKNLPVGTKLYIAPPQREQMLLTDEDIDRVSCAYWGTRLLDSMMQAHREYARAIERASLEKNK